MKTFVKILLVVAGMGLMFSCSKSEDQVEEIPFKATFVGNYMPTTGIYPEMCGEYPMIRVFNEGEGTDALLGTFTNYFDFCVNDLTGEYPFNHMKAYFIAANGDSLFVTIPSGLVKPGKLDHHPEDVTSFFTDEWTVLGGTGSFKGATGGGMTDDYNRESFPANSFHNWTGTINMVKVKR